MLPLILTKPKKILIIGGGNSALIKLKILSKSSNEISCYGLSFAREIDNYKLKKVKKDFYEMNLSEFSEFDLIYFAIAYPNNKQQEEFFLNTISILSEKKLINVLSKPNLSNFIHPCTREKDGILISVSTKKPKLSCALAEKFIDEIEI